MDKKIITPVAYIENDFKEKFGIPRQSGRAPSLVSKIIFYPEFRSPDALRGIEGFCWNNVLNPAARLLKVRLKNATVNDVGSMSLISVCGLPNIFFVALLNSNIMFDYYREFINCTVNIQINDLRQLPVIIPSNNEIERIVQLFKQIITQKTDADEPAPASLKELENDMDNLISSIYSID